MAAGLPARYRVDAADHAHPRQAAIGKCVEPDRGGGLLAAYGEDMTGIGLQPAAVEQRLPCGGFDGRSRTLAADVNSDRSGP